MASIDERPGGSWRVRWQRNGATQTLTFDDEPTAKRAEALIDLYGNTKDRLFIYCEATGEPHPQQARDRRTVAELTPAYIESLHNVEPRTRKGNLARLRRAAFPLIGEMAATDVTGTHIDQIMGALKLRVARTTADRYYNVLKGFFSYCVREGICTTNPVKAIAWKPLGLGAYRKTKEEDHFYMSEREYAILRSHFAPDDQTLLDFLADTGCRWSEATATEVRHIKHRKGTWVLHICQAWKVDDNGRDYLGEPKGGSSRYVDLPMRLVAKISPLMAGRKPTDRLFTHLPTGRAAYYQMRYRWERASVAATRCDLHPPRGEARQLLAAKSRCGAHGGANHSGKPCGQWVVPGWNRCKSHVIPRDTASDCECWDRRVPKRARIHDLRHSHAAQLIAKGIPLKAISRRLGHASIAVTEHVYAGLLGDVNERILAALGDSPRLAEHPFQPGGGLAAVPDGPLDVPGDEGLDLRRGHAAHSATVHVLHPAGAAVPLQSA